jgi:DNA-binding CsgD family transcriptional regulator/NTP pyrophosphatase (non-canonical NTP hydrolase)
MKLEELTAVRRITNDENRIELTKRELEVLTLLCHGRTYNQIAIELFIADATVRTHTNSIFQKLKVSDKAQLVVKALAIGLVLLIPEDCNLISKEKYQQTCQRTANFSGSTTEIICNMCLGLSGEVGELLNYLKKGIFHGHEMKKEDIKEELGDILWYFSVIATAFKLDLNEIMEHNVEKLQKRYPNGFSQTDSLLRRDKDVSADRPHPQTGLIY